MLNQKWSLTAFLIFGGNEVEAVRDLEVHCVQWIVLLFSHILNVQLKKRRKNVR